MLGRTVATSALISSSGVGRSLSGHHICRGMGNEFQDQMFGPHQIRSSEQFARSTLSYAFVNLKPIVRGHVLISPQRVVPRFRDLTAEEVADLWQLTQRVGRVLEQKLGASALTLAIQVLPPRSTTFNIPAARDGPCAGQSVTHVHVHCLPRVEGDFPRNDDVYEALDSDDNRQSLRSEKLDMDAERIARSPEEMAEEAALFRQWLAA